jgi:16S rRNA (guanine966-N2)-methyltransferase
VRIISGTHRGRVINPGKSFSARPTTDFAKESLFNIIANHYDFEELEVLDLFSGTGSISFEFASRGCKYVEAVELNHKHSAFINKTGQELKFNQLKVRNANVFQYLKSLIHKFDIVFADPPYDMEDVNTLPEIILNKSILKPEGVFILEHSKKLNFFDNSHMTDHREYGSVNFSFFK